LRAIIKGKFAKQRIRTPIKAKLVGKGESKAALFTLAEDYLIIQKLRAFPKGTSLQIATKLVKILLRPKTEI